MERQRKRGRERARTEGMNCGDSGERFGGKGGERIKMGDAALLCSAPAPAPSESTQFDGTQFLLSLNIREEHITHNCTLICCCSSGTAAAGTASPQIINLYVYVGICYPPSTTAGESEREESLLRFHSLNFHYPSIFANNFPHTLFALRID